MTPDTLLGFAERNARNIELMLRNAEQQLPEYSGQQLALEQEILTHLGNIATLQLEQSAPQDQLVSLMLKERKAAQAGLQQQLQAIEQQVARTLHDKASLQARLDSLDQRARESLEQDPHYARQAEQLDLAHAAQREHADSYADLSQEYAQKLPTFDANPAYVYLRNQAFGTDRYRRNRLNRWMDTWLASKVRYLANRKNELDLRAMGERNEALQAERETLIRTLSETVDAQLLQARERLGVNALIADAQARQADVDTVKRQANGLQQQLAAYACNEDPHFQRARSRITDQLKKRSIGQLIDMANATPDAADDLIVDQLQVLYASLNALHGQISDIQTQIQQHKSDYGRAKELQRGLRKDLFTGPDVYFDLSANFEDVMRRYMAKDVSLGYVIDLLNQGRQVVRRSQAASRQTFASPRPVPFSAGGGWSSGSSSPSRSSSSSDFRTTDSF